MTKDPKFRLNPGMPSATELVDQYAQLVELRNGVAQLERRLRAAPSKARAMTSLPPSTIKVRHLSNRKEQTSS